MKKLLPFFISLIPFLSCSPPPLTNNPKLDLIIDQFQTASFYSETVDWSSVRKNAYELSNNSDSYMNMGTSLRYILNESGDRNAAIHRNNGGSFFNKNIGHDYFKDYNQKLYGQLKKGTEYPTTVENIGNNIGYVRISSFSYQCEIDNFKKTQEKICSLISSGIDNWVVDLRYLNAGKIDLLIEILIPIIGNGKLGGTIGKDGIRESKWYIQDGLFYKDENRISETPKCIGNTTNSVVLLTSKYTKSLGSTMAFLTKKRVNTFLVGEGPIRNEKISKCYKLDSISVCCTKYLFVDRIGTIFSDDLEVNKIVSFHPTNNLENDIGIGAAKILLQN